MSGEQPRGASPNPEAQRLIDEGSYRPEPGGPADGSPFVHVADLVDPETGNTYRQRNAEIKHEIPIGTLVEIGPCSEDDDPTPQDGARLFVVEHRRDCDMTPLYSLGFPCGDGENPEVVLRGWPECALTEVAN